MNKKRILIVEDEDSTQQLLKYILQKDYNLNYAKSYKEAMQIIEKQSIDLILLDLSLIGTKDGLDIVKKLRKTEKHKDLPVLTVTAHAFTKDRENALKAGCNDYLPKPFTKKELVEKIHQLFADHFS